MNNRACDAADRARHDCAGAAQAAHGHRRRAFLGSPFHHAKIVMPRNLFSALEAQWQLRLLRISALGCRPTTTRERCRRKMLQWR